MKTSNFPRVLSAAALMGNQVVNTAGEQLGILKELMIDLEAGLVAYAVLSSGGLPGLGEKLFAVPWEVLALNPEDHTFILDVDKKILEEAPGFDKDHWPEHARHEAGWLFGLYEYDGHSPDWMPDKKENFQAQTEESR